MWEKHLEPTATHEKWEKGNIVYVQYWVTENYNEFSAYENIQKY